MQRVAVEQSRLHIPLLFGYDVIHGWRTIFPVSLAEAASFDTAAVEGAARVAAVEASAHGVHWTFAPMVDIARDARWGRVVEGAGEDPFLGSAMAAARVRGFQGNDLADPTTDHGDRETLRRLRRGGERAGTTTSPTSPSGRCGRSTSPRSRRRCGLGPARSCRRSTRSAARRRTRASGCWATCSGSAGDFSGLVVSDWTGVEELLKHGIAAERPGSRRPRPRRRRGRRDVEHHLLSISPPRCSTAASPWRRSTPPCCACCAPR